MKNLIEKLENMEGKNNPYYAANIEDVVSILQNTKNLFEVISLSFKYGYTQGQKAILAEQRKRGRNNG